MKTSLGERFHDAFLFGWRHDRLVPFAQLPAFAQARWDSAGVHFAARSAVDEPIGGAEIRNALRLALGWLETEGLGGNVAAAEEIIDTIRAALAVAEKLP